MSWTSFQPLWLFQVLVLEKQRPNFYYAFLSLLLIRRFWIKTDDWKKSIFCSIPIKYITEYFHLISSKYRYWFGFAMADVTGWFCGFYTDILFQKCKVFTAAMFCSLLQKWEGTFMGRRILYFHFPCKMYKLGNPGLHVFFAFRFSLFKILWDKNIQNSLNTRLVLCGHHVSAKPRFIPHQK